MTSIDNKIDALSSPVYQKIMKKNKRLKDKKKLKKIGLFIITNIIVPITVSVMATLITMLIVRL